MAFFTILNNLFNVISNEKFNLNQLIVNFGQDYQKAFAVYNQIRDDTKHRLATFNHLTEEILKGTYVYDLLGGYIQQDGFQTKLADGSSGQQEFLPVYMILRHYLLSGHEQGHLYIEEPEAHLSFKNQGLISKLIAMLLQNKIKVLITTHSDFLIYSINNLILKNMILKNKDKIQKIDFDDDISIDYKKVALYNFILNSNNKSSISKIKIIEDGIKSDYIFNSIYEVTKTKNNLLDMLDSINANN